ncbi:MAG: hypothetical protein ACOC0P_06715, partial [Planctomycetota bacterium]
MSNVQPRKSGVTIDQLHLPRWTRRWSQMLLVTAIIAVIVMYATRLLGPEDFSDQDQPKTTSYTTNIALYPEN